MAEYGEFIRNIQVGVQDRLPKYGPGETKRVIEIPDGNFCYGINLGDIAQAPTDAVMCPTTPWLEMGVSAVEKRLANVMGKKYKSYSSTLQRYLADVLKIQGIKRTFAVQKLANYLQRSTGLEITATPEQIAIDIITAAHMISLEKGGEHIELEYGAAVPMPSGKLKKQGIDTVILVNATPQGTSITTDDISIFTLNACRIANLTGAQSITIPAVGTGAAADLGFGLSQKDSLKGFYHGARLFAKEAGNQARLKKIDYNIYAQPTEDNVQSVAQLIKTLWVK